MKTSRLSFLLKNIFVLISLFSSSLFGQEEDLELYPELQSYIAPSPQSTAFTKYGDYPVNYNTGLVDMRVPIYTVKSGSISLPIDMTFHASGLMANETNGVLGTRWVLNSGGIITRTVQGYPDEWDKLTPYPDEIEDNDQPDFEDLYASCIEGFTMPGANPLRYDTEFDIFNYVLPSGKSGKFILKTVNGEKQAFTIPYESFKVEFTRDTDVNMDGLYSAIKITDVDGTIYNYGNQNLINYKDYIENNYDHEIRNMPNSVPTGWYLESILSADKQDTIHFKYNLGIKEQSDYLRQEIVTDRIRDLSALVYEKTLTNDIIEEVNLTFGDLSTSSPFRKNSIPILTSIEFNQGILDFTYDYSYPSQALKEIVLSGVTDKKFQFEFDHGSVIETDPLFYLKNFHVLSVVDSQEKVEQKYSFDYYNPLYSNNNISGKKDWWGYYCGNTDRYNLFYFPDQPFVRYNIAAANYEYLSHTAGNNNVNRDPNLSSMQSGMLKTITYPTGGSTEFQYESNYYKDGTVKKEGPGIRIERIINRSNQGKDEVRVFKYGENEDGIGYINMDLKPYEHYIKETSMMIYHDFAGNANFPQEEYLGYRVRAYSSDPVIKNSGFEGNITWYDKVTEYFEENSSGNNGKIIFSYSTKEFPYAEQFYINDQHESLHHPFIYFKSLGPLTGGKLIKKTTFKKEGAIFDPVLEETYGYGYNKQDDVWDMPTYRHVTFSVDHDYFDPYGEPWYDYRYDKEEFYHNQICSVIGYGFRNYTSVMETLGQKTVKSFENAEITSTHTYNYSSLNSQIEEEKITNSDEKVISYRYEYPFDNPSIPVNNKMVALHMIGTPLSKSKYVDDVFMQKKGTIYEEIFPDMIRPKNEYFKKATGIEETILEYHSYFDNGNIKEVSKKDGVPIIYIWGYKNNEYPIAKIENASYNSITEIQQTLIDNTVNATINETTETTENNLRANLTLLREGFPNSMVTTYTYDPLIGITSITDAKGYLKYFEYDDFGRLEYVKDGEGKILNETKYHYKSQP